MKNILYSIFIAAIAFCAIKTEAQTIIPGEIPVTYDVSASGAFQYTIPLRIPPGIKSMVPNLAINYNSQGGNGMLGVGWSLSGLSAVTRGAPTIYHDQEIDPVDFDANDVFFLDGQRLVGSGPVYLTEVKNYAHIESFGTAGSGPSYFIVTHPSGVTYEYGNSSDSRMLAQGKQDALIWTVNKVYDAYGNFIIFNYTNTQSAGEYRISKITYGQNSNAGGIPITVNFNYTNRQDVNTAYIAGSEVNSNKLLDNITILFSDNSQANKYQFTYDVNGLSRLTKIEELRDGNEKLQPINITWGGFDNLHDITVANNSTSKRSTTAGDFDGDGFTDFVAFFYNSSNTDMDIFMNSNGILSYHSTINIDFTNTVANEINTAKRLVTDYDGDGRDDIIVYEQLGGGITKTFILWLLRGNGTSSVFDAPQKIYHGANAQNNNLNFHNHVIFTSGDYDGDGKTEVIVIQPYNFQSNFTPIDYEVFIVGQEYSTFLSSYQIHHLSIGQMYSAMTLDYNGDGKDEFMITHNNGGIQSASFFSLKTTYDPQTYKPQLNHSTGWPVTLTSTVTYLNKDYKVWPGDFNGDGKTDVISSQTNFTPPVVSYAYSNGVYNAYTTPGPQVINSTSHVLTAIDISGTATTSGDFNYFAADFNGDGLTDFLEVKTIVNLTSSTYKIFYSNGNSFDLYGGGTVNIDADFRHTSVGDFNGDGQMDLLCGATSGAFKIITFREDDLTLKVTSIEHAGKTIDVDYETIPKYANYEKLPAGHSEYLNRTIPVKVVESVSDNVNMSNTYTYRGFTYHKHGMGIRGFQKFEVQNTNGQKTYQKFNLTSRIPYLSETQVYDALTLYSPYGILTTYQQLDIDGGAGGDSRIILSYADKVTNYLTGQITETTINTGSTTQGTVFYDYGAIESTQVQTKDLANNHNSLQTTTNNYGTNWTTLKGRPESITVFSDIDPNGDAITRTTSYTYNAQNDVETVVSDPGTAIENETTFFYDQFGNIEQTDLIASGIPGTNTSTYQYTSDGKFLAQEENTIGYITTYNYGSLNATWGNLVSTTDEKGLQTTFEYDVLNRVEKITDVNRQIDHLTTYEWASSSAYSTSLPSEQLAITHSNSYNSAFNTAIYDMYGRVLRKAKGAPQTTIYEDITYNSAGKVATSTNPYKNNSQGTKATTIYTYDDYNREVYRTTNNGGQSIQTSYSIVNGLLQTKVDNVWASKDKTSVTCGSTLKKVLRTVPGGPDEISYTYHGNGVTATTITNGLTMTNTLDQFGRVQSNTQPNAGTKTYEYDALDRVTKEIMPSGDSWEFSYDLLGRIKEKWETGQVAPNIYTYTYYDVLHTGATGELISKTAPNSYEYKYSYTTNGQLALLEEHTSFAAPVTTNYDYYNDGSLQNYYFYNDLQIQYNYDLYGNVNEAAIVAAPAGMTTHKLWERWAENAYGQQEGAYYFDVADQPLYFDTRDYDAFGYPTNKQVGQVFNGVPIFDREYTFDVQSGNLYERKDVLTGRDFTERFTYDDNRLKKVEHSMGSGAPYVTSFTMQYDLTLRGNIKEKTDVVPPHQYLWKYDGYALKTVPLPTNIPANISIPFFQQDVEYYPFQKVSRIYEHQQNEILFTYGPDNQRVQADYLDNTATLLKTKRYAHNLEQTEDPLTGDLVELAYVWAGDELISVIEMSRPKHTQQVNGIVYYPVRDYLGSIIGLLDDNGFGGALGNGLIEERSFDSWGRPREPNTWVPYNPATGNPHPGNWITDRGYTGHEHIWCSTPAGFYDNNIINMNGRLYDPQVGRMFSPDPYITDVTNSMDYNKYSYARNNPLRYTDPDGNYVMEMMLMAGTFAGGMNMITNASNIHSWKDGLKYFSIGFTAGFAGGGIGVAAAGAVGAGGAIGGTQGLSGFAGGAIISGSSGATSAFIGVSGNAWAGGARFGDGLVAGGKAALISGVISGFAGGLVNGISSGLQGRNFFTGRLSDDAVNTYFDDLGIEFTGERQTEDDARSMWNKYFSADAKEVDAEYIGINDEIVGEDANAVTKPKSYRRAAGSKIYLHSKALVNDRTLYLTFDHELVHAKLYYNGSFANIYMGHRNLTAAQAYSEIHAYSQSANTAKNVLNNPHVYDWARFRVARNAFLYNFHIHGSIIPW